MTARVAAWLLLLALCVVRSSAPSSAAPVEAPAAQVLVLLRLPPPHLRPGSDYGGSYGDGAGRAARRRLALAIARRNGLALADDWPMPLLAVDCFVMNVAAGRSAEAVALTLSGMPGVVWAQPVNRFSALSAPGGRPDPLFAAQPATVGWQLADLHRLADGRGVRVAVIDSAVDRSHPDLAGQVITRENFVVGRADTAEHHGTAIAGIIAAVADNGIGIAGIAPRARLMALRACWQQAAPSATVCDSFSLAKALYFAVEARAGVINLSLGGPPDPLLARLLDVALARRITVVAAVDRQRVDGGFPASHRGVVAVANDGAGVLPPGVLTAPGLSIPATLAGGRWGLVDGSSYAAAQVSGLFALVRGKQGASSAPVSLVTLRPGGGAIDACASLTRTGADRSGTCSTQSAVAARR